MATNEPKIDFKILDAAIKKVLEFKPKKKQPTLQEKPKVAGQA